MTANSVYQRILAEMPEGLENQIMLILAEGDHIGQENRINKKALYQVVAGRFPVLRRAAWFTLDRLIRKAIENLQNEGYPVISDSGYGGYWIGRRQEIETYVGELESRRDALANKIKALHTANKLTWVYQPKPPIQQRLW